MMLRPPGSGGSLVRFGWRLGAAVLVACGGVVGCDKSTSDRDITTITTAETRKLIAERDGKDRAAVLLIDPRPEAEFAAGHLPGARNVRLPDVPHDGGRERWIDRYDKIVVYGNDPSTAAAKAMHKRLLSLGYEKVRWFEGGIAEWRAAGGEVETRE